MRTEYNNALPNFVADPGYVGRYPDGAQVDWDAVDPDDFTDANTGKRRLPAGTVVSRFATGKIAPYGSTDAAASPDETPTTAIGLLASEANEDALAEAASGYGIIVEAMVWENLLPDAVAGSLAGGTKTALTNGGARIRYRTYSDDRAS